MIIEKLKKDNTVLLKIKKQKKWCKMDTESYMMTNGKLV